MNIFSINFELFEHVFLNQVHNTNKDFIIQLELRDYQPDEINVTSDDHQVTITAKCERLRSTDGCVSRAVTHVYNLPEVKLLIMFSPCV